MQDRPRYQVTEAHGFLARAIVEVGDVWIWDEIKFALDLALARDPTAFQHIADDLYAVQVTTLPPRAVYFTVDKESFLVCLVEIF